jgi:hypothetical protein
MRTSEEQRAISRTLAACIEDELQAAIDGRALLAGTNPLVVALAQQRDEAMRAAEWLAAKLSGCIDEAENGPYCAEGAWCDCPDQEMKDLIGSDGFERGDPYPDCADCWNRKGYTSTGGTVPGEPADTERGA